MYGKTQETMAMLKLLAMTSVHNKNASDINSTFSELRSEFKTLH